MVYQIFFFQLKNKLNFECEVESFVSQAFWVRFERVEGFKNLLNLNELKLKLTSV